MSDKLESPSNLGNDTLLLVALPQSKLDDLKYRLQKFGYMFFVANEHELEGLQLKKKPRLAIIEASTEEFNTNLEYVITQLRDAFADIRILIIFSGKLNYNIDRLFLKNIEDVFQFPFEEELIVNAVFEFSPIEIISSDLTLDALANVNVLEIEKTGDLPFDIYICLPHNEKVLLYRTKGQPLDARTIEKFKNNSRYKLYIKKSDINLYHTYTADILANIQNDPEMTELERRRKFSTQVKKLMKGFFSNAEKTEEDGQVVLDNMKNVLEHLIDEEGKNKKIFEIVEQLFGQLMTNHTHARNVATYCQLFGLALGIHDAETLKMGGLLHDLGISDLPEEIQNIEYEAMSEDQQAQYKLHPGNAKYTLQMQKLKLPKSVINMIMQHHECPDGSGYPYCYKADEIDPFAKVCAFADEFDKLTSIRFGHTLLTPAAAMKRIAGLDGHPALPIYEEAFHLPLVQNFLAEEDDWKFGKASGTKPSEVQSTVFEVDPSSPESAAPLEQQAAPADGPVNSTAGDIKIAKEFGSAGSVKTKESAVIKSGKVSVKTDAASKVDFLEAAKKKNLDLINQLVNAGTGNIDRVDAEGKSAIFYAILNGSKDLLKSLFRAKPNLNIQDGDRESALMIAVQTKNFELVSTLLAYSFQATPHTEHNPASSTWVSKIVDVNLLDGHQESALMMAARGGDSNIVDALLNAGADKSFKNTKGQTACDIATEANQTHLISTLTDISDLTGESVSDNNLDTIAANLDSKNKAEQTPLIEAISRSDDDAALQFLASGANVDAVDNSGQSSLMLAAKNGTEKVVLALIKANANLKLTDNFGRSALLHAIEGGNQNVVQAILKSGGDPNFKIKGSSALMLSAFLGNIDVVKILLAEGAEPNEKDSKGKTAIEYAMAKGNKEIAELIRSIKTKNVA